MRVSTALVASMLCFCWNSFTQLVTLLTISVAALRAASRAARAVPGFRWLRSARLTTLTTFFSDIILFGKQVVSMFWINEISDGKFRRYSTCTGFGKATFRRCSPRFGCRIIPPQPVFISRQHLLPWLAYRFSRVSSVLGKLGGQELLCHKPRHRARPL